RRKALDRRDRLLPDAPDPRDAGAGAGAVEQPRAGTALPFAAAVAASGQAEIVAEDGEEAVARLGVNLAILAIDAQDISSHRGDFKRAQGLRPGSERGRSPASIEKCRREAARAYDAATQRRERMRQVSRLVLAFVVAVAGTAVLVAQDDALTAKARGIHERVMTLDTHNDINPGNFTTQGTYKIHVA